MANTHQKIGRNDPCHCGSNKKYKKCCLENDQKRESQNIAEEHYQKIKEEENLTDSQLATVKALGWMSEKYADAVLNAITHFVGSPEIEEAKKVFPGEDGDSLISQLFNEYALLDYEDEQLNSTLLALYLEENKDTLNEAERESLEIKLNTYKTLYEAQKISQGRGIMLKDYFSGEKFWVKENIGTKSVKKWDIIFARVETYPDGTKKMTGSLVGFPREADLLDSLKQQYKDDQRLFTDNEEMRLFNFRHLMTPMIFQTIIEHYANFANKMMAGLVNKDGDKLIFCHKTAVVTDHEQLDLYLKNNNLLTLTYEDGKEKTYCWLDEKSSIIASFYLKKRKLTIETNSEKRTEEVNKNFITDIKKWTKNWQTELKKPETLLDQDSKINTDEKVMIESKFIEDSDGPLSKNEKDKIIAKQIKKHYDNWIDMKIPALGGMTPRQASKNKESREKLIELLKTMENKDARGKNVVGCDVERIKRKLGIKF